MSFIPGPTTYTEVEKSKLSLLEKIFKSPQEAFDLYLRDSSIGRKELLRLHYALWVVAPVAKIFGNIVNILLDWFSSEEIDFNIFSGALTSFLIYPVLFILVSQLDVVRVFYRKIDRTKGETFPPADVLAVAFLPFSASSIFWILPSPIHLGLIGIAFLYSAYLCFVGMKRVSGTEPKEVLIFFLVGISYLLSVALIFTIIYNIIRTLLN